MIKLGTADLQFSLMATQPWDPSYWGIKIKVDRLDSKWTPRVADPAFSSPQVPEEVASIFPALAKIRKRFKAITCYWETRVPHPDALWWQTSSGWHPGAQTVFDGNWPSELDVEVDLLIEQFGSSWHTAFQVLAPVRWPWFTERLAELTRDGELELSNMYKGHVDVTVGLALVEGPYRATLKRRTWPFPNEQICSVCGCMHYADTVRYYLVRDYGGPGVCPTCLTLASSGFENPIIRPVVTLSEALAALCRLSDAAGVIPPASFRSTIKTAGFSPQQRALIIAGLVATPDSGWFRDALEVSTWLQVLQEAGLVGEAWRLPRGTMCIARDGHPCRSLGEKVVCDWLSASGIAHDVEPLWPPHRELNPAGKLRADWRIGEIFVELAGMMSDKEYAQKMDIKRRLAHELSIELIILLPEDLGRLKEVFGLIADGGE